MAASLEYRCTTSVSESNMCCYVVQWCSILGLQAFFESWALGRNRAVARGIWCITMWSLETETLPAFVNPSSSCVCVFGLSVLTRRRQSPSFFCSTLPVWWKKWCRGWRRSRTSPDWAKMHSERGKMKGQCILHGCTHTKRDGEFRSSPGTPPRKHRGWPLQSPQLLPPAHSDPTDALSFQEAVR